MPEHHRHYQPAQRPRWALGLLAALALAGCGSSNTPSPASAPSAQASTSKPSAASPTSASTPPPAGALSGEANSAATGDIPDNQVFLSFTDSAAGWSMKYPEGWTTSGPGPRITFSDKNNLVRVTITRGPAPTPSSVAAALKALKGSSPSLSFTQPHAFPLPADQHAVKATYTTQSAPNQVTGKRVTLIVDRYVLHHGGRVATVDLGTPRGVDNVDAYRMMIRSFHWR